MVAQPDPADALGTESADIDPGLTELLEGEPTLVRNAGQAQKLQIEETSQPFLGLVIDGERGRR